jgi:hypothetical protein
MIRVAVFGHVKYASSLKDSIVKMEKIGTLMQVWNKGQAQK